MKLDEGGGWAAVISVDTFQMMLAALISDNGISVQAVVVDSDQPRVGVLCQCSPPGTWEPLWAVRDGDSMELLPGFELDAECVAALDEVMRMVHDGEQRTGRSGRQPAQWWLPGVASR